MKLFTSFLSVSTCLIVVTSLKARTQHKVNKKKYVIEVQDHQSAMKAANPLVDLEDSVRRGINDPLSDPRFVMNKINDEFFGSPIRDSLLHSNSELLSYQGKGRSTAPIVGVNTNSLHGPTPGNPFQQNANKDQVIAKHPSSIPTFEDIGFPRQSSVHHSYLTNQIPSSFKGEDVTANIGQNVAGGLDRGLPGGVAAFMSKSRFAPFAKGVQIGRIPAEVNREVSSSRLSHIISPQHRLFNQKLPNSAYRQQLVAARQQRVFYKSLSPSPKNSINPLTGLPEDLEDSSLGSVSSITSVSDPTPALPTSITVDTSEGAPQEVYSGSKTQQPQAMYPTNKQEDYAESVKHNKPTKQGTSLEALTNDKSSSDDNFSSLKAFLEADNLLRNKLAQDGIDTIDTNKKFQR